MVFPDWSGQTVAVLACGPSAPEIAPQIVGRFPIIAVNLAFRLAPGAEIVYAADGGFWHVYQDARRHPGLKVSADDRAPLYCPGVQLVNVKDRHVSRVRMLRSPLGELGAGGGNSGFQAVNLAVQLGARRILLAGLDFCGEHWHGRHPPALFNPTTDQLKRWARFFDDEAPVLASWGIEVLNLSRISALRGFPYADCNSIDS